MRSLKSTKRPASRSLKYLETSCKLVTTETLLLIHYSKGVRVGATSEARALPLFKANENFIDLIFKL